MPEDAAPNTEATLVDGEPTEGTATRGDSADGGKKETVTLSHPLDKQYCARVGVPEKDYPVGAKISVTASVAESMRVNGQVAAKAKK